MKIAKLSTILVSLVLWNASASLSSAQVDQNSSLYTVTIVTAKPVVEMGSQVDVGIILTNTSQRPLAVTAVAPEMAELNYAVQVQKGDGSPAMMTSYYQHLRSHITWGGKTMLLQSGKKQESDLDLNRLYDLEAPGVYTIQVTRIGPTKPMNPSPVSSKTLTLTVTPASGETSQVPAPSKPSFSISLSAVQDRYRFPSGSTITFQIALTNTSNHEIDIPQSIDKKAELDFAIDVSRADGSAVTKTPYGESISETGIELPTASTRMIHLAAGASMVESVTLNELYEIGPPGRYLVEVSRADDAVVEIGKRTVRAKASFVLLP